MNCLFCLLQPQPIWSASQHSVMSEASLKSPSHLIEQSPVPRAELCGSGLIINPATYLQTAALTLNRHVSEKIETKIKRDMFPSRVNTQRQLFVRRTEMLQVMLTPAVCDVSPY